MTLNERSEPEPVQQSYDRGVTTDVSEWRVLIVDDVFDNILIAETVLEFNGAEVRTAYNGVEGLKIMESFIPNLILLDLAMPEMNGWEMHKQMRETPSLASIPVIALTAHAMRGDRESVLAAGFDGYISKPFSVKSLIGDIQAILKLL